MSAPGAILTLAAGLAACAEGRGAPQLAGGPVFPANNVWNTRVDTLPVHSNSLLYVNTIGASRTLHPDFGSGDWPTGSGSPIGIPFVVVPGTQAPASVTFTYSDESDPGPYPIPGNAPIEGGAASTGDRHVLVVDRDHRKLYELYAAYPGGDGSWRADSGAVFGLSTNSLRPAGWTSADAAGLPILPGLVRYEEVAAGALEHAIRFTAPQTRRGYVWPARHVASSLTGQQYPPMGQRFRLRSGYDVSGFSPAARTILVALKRYGMILADNGSAWYLSGAPDERWNNDVLGELKRVAGSDFEAVDVTPLMRGPDSAAVRYPQPAIRGVSVRSDAINLTVADLFPGCDYMVERAPELPSQEWGAAVGFRSEATVTNGLRVPMAGLRAAFVRLGLR